MKILGIDTATPFLALGIVEENEILSEIRFNAKQAHAQLLLPNIEKLLNEANMKLKDLDGIAISIGPGSFTGLRIGLSTAKGLCFATGKSLISVPTLDALVYSNNTSSCHLVPILDAKKNEVYAAVYKTRRGKIERTSDYCVSTVEKLIAKIPKEVIFLGPGLEVFEEKLKRLYKGKAYFLEGEKNLPNGAAVACLGLEKLQRSEYENLEEIEPIYLRKSEAELRFRHG